MKLICKINFIHTNFHFSNYNEELERHVQDEVTKSE